MWREASLVGMLNHQFLPSQRETTNTLPHPHDDEEEEEEKANHGVTSFSSFRPGSVLFTATLCTV